MPTTTSFYIATDIRGRNPTITYDAPATCYYVQYIRNRPVEVSKYPTQDRVWCYATKQYLGLRADVRVPNGVGFLPQFEGFLIIPQE